MKNDSFFWYTLTKANILFYFVIVKNKDIADKLFKQFKSLDESMMGDQGDKKDPTNFEKFVVMVFSSKNDKQLKSKQIWTKSNHLLETKYNKEFINALGLEEDFFKGQIVDIDTIDTSKNIQYFVEYENIPTNIISDFGFYDHPNCRYMDLREIKYFLPNKEKLEQFLLNNKFNL